LILGCTHYPLIKKQINQYYDGKVTVLDTSEIVAKSLYDYLENNHLLNDMNAHIRHFYVSDYTQSFETSTKIFFGEQIRLQHYPLWE
jgi:glutamate racemase